MFFRYLHDDLTTALGAAATIVMAGAMSAVTGRMALSQWFYTATEKGGNSILVWLRAASILFAAIPFACWTAVIATTRMHGTGLSLNQQVNQTLIAAVSILCSITQFLTARNVRSLLSEFRLLEPSDGLTKRLEVFAHKASIRAGWIAWETAFFFVLIGSWVTVTTVPQQQSRPLPPNIGIQVAAATTTVALTGIALRLGKQLSYQLLPHLELIELIRSWPTKTIEESKQGAPLNLRISRWRTPSHKIGFKAAASLERAIRGLQGRLVDDELTEAVIAFRRLANRIRRTSIDAARDRATITSFQALGCMAVGLLVVDSPSLLSKQIADALTDEPDPRPSERWRGAIIVESFSGYIQRVAPGFRIILLTSVILTLLTTVLAHDRFDDAWNILVKLVSP